MTRERVTKPVTSLQRTPDVIPQARVPTRPVPLPRTPIALTAKTVTAEQLETQRTQQLEVQRLADLEVQRAVIQRAHDDRLQTSRAVQSAWRSSSLKSAGVQRAAIEHVSTARAAQATRADFVAQRQPELLEGLVAQRLVAATCPALPAVQRQADLTLSHVADHYGDKAAVQLAQDPTRLSSYAGFKNAGAGLVKTFRTPGSSHTIPELASAIQRFREPMQRAAVQGAAFAAFGSHPTYPQQLQRALEERDASLNVQRAAWQAELEPVAQRQALEEMSGEGAAGMIESARGGGQPLPAGVRAMLETKWNTDLSKVRVHTDSSAAVISKKLNAKALTTGQDIFFGASTFNPTSLEGLQLIAHEAWHTVQQAGGLVEKGVDKSQSLELEARGKGSELSSGDLEIASSGSGLKAKGTNNSSTRAVQRDPKSAAIQLQTAAQSGKTQTINIPIDASVTTRKQLMVRTLVHLGYDEDLALLHTNNKGEFRYKKAEWSWDMSRTPTPEEIRNKIARISFNSARLSRARDEATSANKLFRAETPTLEINVIGTRRRKQITEGAKLNIRGAAFKEGEDVKLRSSMNTTESNIIAEIPYTTTFLITDSTSSWYKIRLDSGKIGFVAQENISIAPEADAKLYLIKSNESAIDIAGSHYDAKVGLDLRFYILVLAKLNPRAIIMPKGVDWNDPSSWKKANPLKENYIWIPSKEYAKSLKGMLSNGRLSDDPLKALAQVGQGIVKKTIGQLPGGDKVLEAITKIGSNSQKVLDNPGAFVTNCGNALSQGFGQFRAELPKTLEANVIKLFTGTMGTIDVPKTLDANGVLHMGLQLVGGAPKQLEAKFIKQVGGTAAINASGEAKDIFQKIQRDGFAPTVAGYYTGENLQSTIVDGVKNYVIQKVVTEGIKMLASMFIPGAGIIQATIKLYETIKFIWEKMKDIAKTAEAMTSSLAEIAAGNTGVAATRVKESLQGILGLGVNFLARMARLDGIGTWVQNKLKPIKKSISSAWDMFVAKFKGLVKGKGTKPITSSNTTPNISTKPVTGATTSKPTKRAITGLQINIKEPITPKNQPAHALVLKGEISAAKLEVHSNPKTFTAWVASVKTNLSPAPNSSLAIQVTLAEKNARLIYAAKKASKAIGDANYNRMVNLMNKLGDTMERILELSAMKPPASVVKYGPLNGGQQATLMHARVLSNNFVEGSVPKEDSTVMKTIKTNRNDGRAIRYVEGHLLNHNIGGKGELYNLTVLSRVANSAHSNEVEKEVKRLITAGKVLEYIVTPDYSSTLGMTSNEQALEARLASLGATDPNRASLTRQLGAMEYERVNLAYRLNAQWHELSFDNTDVQWKKSGATQRKNIDNTLDERVPEPTVSTTPAPATPLLRPKPIRTLPSRPKPTLKTKPAVRIKPILKPTPDPTTPSSTPLAPATPSSKPILKRKRDPTTLD